ncbi:MAG: SDR family oxidoreductase [Promethearchaeota archaeon]
MKTAKKAKVILITGTSRGFGFLTAKKLSLDGHRVYASMRDSEGRNIASKERLEDFAAEHDSFIEVIECDVTKRATINNAVASVVNKEGRIDVLVNNAGYGVVGPLEFCDEDTMRKIFDVNVYGYLRMIQATLPIMKKQRSGLIINIASMMGEIAIPYFGLYSSTKFAVVGLSQSLAGEACLFNIKVVVLEPMAYLTDFLRANLKKVVNVDESGEYNKAFSNLLESIPDLGGKNDPDEVAAKIAWIIRRKKPPFRVPVGNKAKSSLIFSRVLDPCTLQKLTVKVFKLKNIFEKN